MNAIEIRLDPGMVSSLLDVIRPSMDHLESNLATDAKSPDEDPMMVDIWRHDLLASQRDDVTVIQALFGPNFMLTGAAVIEPEDMDRVLRACSALRLRLRETILSPLADEQLESGNLEGIDWTHELRIGYGAYALFASLQELIISQVFDDDDDEEQEDDEEEEGDEDHA